MANIFADIGRSNLGQASQKYVSGRNGIRPGESPGNDIAARSKGIYQMQQMEIARAHEARQKAERYDEKQKQANTFSSRIRSSSVPTPLRRN